MKLYVIRARVTTQMKRELAKMSQQRGEAEAVLVREALKQYIKKYKQPRRKGGGNAGESNGHRHSSRGKELDQGGHHIVVKPVVAQPG